MLSSDAIFDIVLKLMLDWNIVEMAILSLGAENSKKIKKSTLWYKQKERMTKMVKDKKAQRQKGKSEQKKGWWQNGIMTIKANDKS